MTFTEQRLVDYLKKYAYGKGNAIRRKDIVQALSIPDRELRQMKGRIVREHGIPIGSTEKGYFYASNDLEIMHFKNEYNSRLLECKEMMIAYEGMVKNKNQMSML